jgi:hypothetical protein
MKKLFALILLAAASLFSGEARAQGTCPYIAPGAILTSAQWQACFSAKQNFLGFTPLNPSNVVGVPPITVTPSGGVLDIACSTFTAGVAGCVPPSGGGTANFLRADGTWTPPGGGVTSVFGRTGAVTAQSADYTFAQIGSKPTTIAGYGITDNLVNTFNGRFGTVVPAANDYTFAQLASTPTTLAGYGITSPLPYAQGGCNATTQVGCTNNIFPTPTRAGDIAYWNGSTWVTIPGNNSGTNFLSENSSGTPSWVAAAAGCTALGAFPVGLGASTQCSTVAGSAAIVNGPLTATVPNGDALIARSGVSNADTKINIGRTSDEFALGIVGVADHFATGTVPGDAVIEPAGTLWLLPGNNSGTNGAVLNGGLFSRPAPASLIKGFDVLQTGPASGSTAGPYSGNILNWTFNSGVTGAGNDAFGLQNTYATGWRHNCTVGGANLSGNGIGCALFATRITSGITNPNGDIGSVFFTNYSNVNVPGGFGQYGGVGYAGCDTSCVITDLSPLDLSAGLTGTATRFFGQRITLTSSLLSGTPAQPTSLGSAHLYASTGNVAGSWAHLQTLQSSEGLTTSPIAATGDWFFSEGAYSIGSWANLPNLTIANFIMNFANYSVKGDGSTVLGAATGGNKGAGTINAVGCYVNGAACGVAGAVEPQGRITLTANVPVMTASAAAVTTLRYDCAGGRYVPYFDGATDQIDAIASCDVTSAMANSGTGVLNANGVFDVWWVHSGANRICVATNGAGGGWASDTGGSNTARGTGYTMLNFAQRGYLTNANALTHCYNGATDYGSVPANRATYLGTICTDAGAAGSVSFTYGSAASGGGAARFCVWNYYNRRSITTSVIDNGAAYNLAASGTPQQARASAGNQITFVVGVNEDGLTWSYATFCTTGPSTFNGCEFGVGFDTTTSYSTSGSFVQTNANAATNGSATNSGVWNAVIGLHTLSANENAVGATALMNAGSPTQPGNLQASLRM